MTTTLYLHGFCSHPNTNKGRLLRKAHEEAGLPFIAPPLHVGPRKAADIILEAVRGIEPEDLVVIGSSLGGFYATWLTERLGCRAVLLNPAVSPWNVVGENLGKHELKDIGVTIEVVPSHVDELKKMRTTNLKHPRDYLTFLGNEDEMLDWTEGLFFYRDTQVRIVEGGDHRFSHFEELIPEIMRFIQQKRPLKRKGPNKR